MERTIIANTRESKEIFEDIESRAKGGERVSPMLLASIAAELRNYEKARQWLERAFADKNDYMLYLEIAPEYKALRNEKWFKEIVERVVKKSSK